ncbi:tRNA (adenine(22)-N(1))-methyltransferase TrmK [Mycoplasmoides pneumoniae]|uniref:tRNA (adenine(22)-N(1))-methyltransferase TrmK n=1 Tax=Mycoplasmoides pneumoniae TaxID=2104 RepID=UPI0006BA6A34|nr:tRNA (adenine(22)-N(1))-methyltransferase TrmK [Mycoplasmoides pneumoniae]
MKRRISTIANLVLQQKPKAFYDIGCDHGYLARELVQQNPSLVGVNSDISANALGAAKGLLKDHTNMHFITSDGFDLLPNLNLDPAVGVIAGLGGLKIMQILAQHNNFLKHFVLQPQSNIIELRRFLSANQWTITTETLVEERGFIYLVLAVDKTKAQTQYLTEEQMILGPHLVNFTDKQMLVKYYNGLLKNFTARLNPSQFDSQVIRVLNKII